LSDTTCALHGLVRPGDPPACGQVRNTLGAYLPAKPGVPERNHHDLLHALVIQERDLLAAEWARLVFAQFSVPWLAAQQDCSAGQLHPGTRRGGAGPTRSSWPTLRCPSSRAARCLSTRPPIEGELRKASRLAMCVALASPFPRSAAYRNVSATRLWRP